MTVQQIQPKKLFLRAGLHLALDDARFDPTTTCKELENGLLDLLTVQAGACFYVVVVNKHENKSYYLITDYSSSRGVESVRGVMQSQDYIPPNSRQIIATVV